jgi:hypothetical protein
MSLTAKEAAEQVGMTRQGIMKAMRQGKISAQKDLNGEWRIEPVELFRVYEPVSFKQPDETSFHQDTAEDMASLQVELRLLRERLADKEDVIEDLRERLDAEVEERRKEAEERRKLTFLLTDKQHEDKEAGKRGFWQRLFS